MPHNCPPWRQGGEGRRVILQVAFQFPWPLRWASSWPVVGPGGPLKGHRGAAEAIPTHRWERAAVARLCCNPAVCSQAGNQDEVVLHTALTCSTSTAQLLQRHKLAQLTQRQAPIYFRLLSITPAVALRVTKKAAKPIEQVPRWRLFLEGRCSHSGGNAHKRDLIGRHIPMLRAKSDATTIPHCCMGPGCPSATSHSACLLLNFFLISDLPTTQPADVGLNVAITGQNSTACVN